MKPITIRKTLARLVFTVYSMRDGNTLEDTMKHLEFTNEEFNYMMQQSLMLSQMEDDSNLLLMDKTTQPIGSVQIINEENKTVALI